MPKNRWFHTGSRPDILNRLTEGEGRQAADASLRDIRFAKIVSAHWAPDTHETVAAKLAGQKEV
jgi:hypothetical protein